MFGENIKTPRPHTVLAPELSYVDNKTRVKFNGSCLAQNKYILSRKNSKYVHCIWINSS